MYADRVGWRSGKKRTAPVGLLLGLVPGLVFATALVAALLAPTVLSAFIPSGAAQAAGSSGGGCTSSRHVVCLTRTDGGHDVRVRLGQKVDVDLSGSGLRWRGLHEVGPRLLRAEGSAAYRSNSATQSFAAVRTGRTALQASGEPICAAGQACPQFILLWRVNIRVVA